MLALVETKACTRCGVEKVLEEFGLTHGKRNAVCRSCIAAAARERRRDPAARAAHAAAQRRYAQKRLAADPVSFRAKEREKRQRHHELHPDARAAEHQRNRAAYLRRRGFDDVEYYDILRGDVCAYCGAAATEVDHIDAGSSGSPDNLTAACRSCNAAKKRTPLLHFMLSRCTAH